MIQELLGSSGLISGERRINNPITNGTNILHATPPPPPPTYPHTSPSSTPTTTTTSTAAAGAIPTTTTTGNSSTPSPSSSTPGEHLRCPRCDSSNTKFCYYNNYNLTQPRHFCKTCRRYWTKGGALRNVPIGGGCRKNKSTSGLITSSSSSAGVVSTFGKPNSNATTTTADKLKLLSSSSSSSPSLFGASLYDLHLQQHHHQDQLPSSPILWPSPQTNSHHHHFLSLLRSSPNPQNPNPNPSSTATPPVKDGISNLFGAAASSTTTSSNHLFEPSTTIQTLTDAATSSSLFEPSTTARTLAGWDTTPNQQLAPSLGLNYPPIPIWMGDSNGNGYLVGSDEPHHNNNTGMHEVYQRMKVSAGTSSGYEVFNDNNTSSCFSSAGGASSSSMVAPVAGGGGFLGYSWNPAAFTSSTATTTTTASWSDLPTTGNNGTAYP